MINRRLYPLMSSALLTLVSLNAQAQGPKPAADVMPVYVTPYYDSNGPDIRVGKFSAELKKATRETIGGLKDKMHTDWKTLPVETMFVMSIRLYDLGLKDEAIYWYYAAQYRGALLQKVLARKPEVKLGAPDFELMQALGAFKKLTGGFINRYAFGVLPVLDAAVVKVIDDSAVLPDFKTIYPELKYSPVESWPEKSNEVKAGITELLTYIRENPEEIKKQREANNVK